MEISVEELKEKLNRSIDFKLIDVREPWEFEESRIDGAVNVPLYGILDNLDTLGTKEDVIIVYCRTGVRGNTARAVLNQHGYVKVHNLTGGITAFLELAG